MRKLLPWRDRVVSWLEGAAGVGREAEKVVQAVPGFRSGGRALRILVAFFPHRWG
jgi:hypothetical protein